jgi:hypothetical protein
MKTEHTRLKDITLMENLSCHSDSSAGNLIANNGNMDERNVQTGLADQIC